MCLSQVPTQAEINKMIEQAKKIAADPKASNKISSQKTSVKQQSGFPTSIVKIPLKQPVQVPTPAQAKDKLLWYRGKKLNDSMLVTTKGMVVLYSKKRALVITQSLKPDPFKKIISNLSKARQLTNEYLTKTAATKNSFMNYPLIQMAVDEFNDIDERFNELVRNTIELPQDFTSETNISTGKHRGGDDATPIEGELDQMHKNLQELLRNPPSMNFKAPPKKEFSLSYTCDSNAQKQYKQARQEWEEEFLEYENKLISSVLQIERFVSLTGTIPISKTEPGAPSLGEDMQTAFKEAFERMNTKVKTLTGQHGKNIFSQDIVIYNALRNERSKQLLGVETNSQEALLTVGGLVEGKEFENYINEQIKALNYDVIFNVAIILGRGRQSIFLGSESTSEIMQDLFFKIQQINRFSLSIEVDFNMQYNDGEGKPILKASSTIITKNKTFVSLARTGCKWTLHLTDTDYEKGKETEYYIPMKITTGVKLVKKENDKWISYAYSGPADMSMHFPVFKIDFGDHLHEDTAIIQPMRYDPGISLAAYANNVSNSYTVDLLGYLSHVFISASKAEANEKALTNLANDMISKFSSMTGMSGTSPLEQLKVKYERMLQKMDFEKTISNSSGLPKTTLFFNAFNNSAVLIDNQNNTAHKDKDVEVTNGLIKLKVVHAPISN